MEITKELKQFATAIIGDIRVDVNIEYTPNMPMYDNKDKMLLRQVNAELAQMGGEIGFEIKDMLRKKFSETKDN